MFVDGIVVKSWSRAQRGRSLSSAQAEFYAIVTGAAQALAVQALAEEMGCKMSVRVHTDSSAAFLLPGAKETRNPELVGDRGRAHLVVLSGEVGGRFSLETAHFLRCPASAEILQGQAHAALLRRWSSMLACAAARAFALSLLSERYSPGLDGPTPSVHEVLGDFRHAL